MPTNFALIQAFHQRFDPVNEHGEALESLLTRRMAYITEEVREAAAATEALRTNPTNPQAKANLAKELTDILHVTYGYLHLLNIDADAAFAEVHRSNMSKTPNPQGKAIKGETYTPANMEKFV